MCIRDRSKVACTSRSCRKRIRTTVGYILDRLYHRLLRNHHLEALLIGTTSRRTCIHINGLVCTDHSTCCYRTYSTTLSKVACTSRSCRKRIRTTVGYILDRLYHCLLYTSPSPRDRQKSRMPSSA